MSLIGQILQDRYIVVGEIGKGGMGRVYYAEDSRLKQPVAIKETYSDSIETIGTIIKSFQREAFLLAGQIKHSAIPKVIDYFQIGQNWYIVMEYIEGDNLEKQRRERANPFEIKEVILIISQLLHILESLHSQNPPIIHRDIKPSNIKVNNDQVYLLDFGLAKQVSVGSKSSTALFTKEYASPEQLNNHEVTEKSDLYSVAATMYCLLANEEPANSLERSISIAASKIDPLKNIMELCPSLNAETAKLIMTSLSINPDERPHSAKLMRLKLLDYNSESNKTFLIAQNLHSADQPPETNSAEFDPNTISVDEIEFNEFIAPPKTLNKIPAEVIHSAAPVTPEGNKVPLQSSPNNKMKYLLIGIPALGLVFLTIVALILFLPKLGKNETIASNTTTLPSPTPTPDPRELAVQFTNEALDSFFNNDFTTAKEKAQKAIGFDDSYLLGHTIYGESTFLENSIKSASGFLDETDKRTKQEESTKLNKELSDIRIKIQNSIKNPSNLEELASYAWYWNASGERESKSEVIKYADEAIKLKQDFVWAWYLKATNKQEKTKDSIDSWNKVIALKPNFATAYLRQARNFEDDVKKEGETIKLFDKAISAWKNSPIPYNWKGNFLFRKKKYKEAIKEYESILKIDSKNSTAILSIANTYIESKDNLQCIKIIEEALNNKSFDNEKLASFHSYRAICSLNEFSKGNMDYEKSIISDIEKSISFSTDEDKDFYIYRKASILNDIGVYYWNKKLKYKVAKDKFKEASEVLKKALEISPTNESYLSLKKTLDGNLKNPS